ncbi:hypothetical protein ACOI1C_02670 [Bacillus sp. DJP31]|uniref:hypothetical protein n=1 Tax=Bacillus sp. DJP31 TaxID=3409789 RepID=UPI003BB5922D
MDLQRKEIILKEIEYWKKNRLLPEQYCNFLLTLYSEGNHEIEGKKKNLKITGFIALLPVLFLFLLPITFLALYFTEMSFGLQMCLNFILIIILVAFSLFFHKKNHLYQTFFIVFAFLLFFVTSIELVDYFYDDYSFVIGATVLSHCLLWFLVGKKMEMKTIKYSGIAGSLLFFGYLSVQYFIF